MPTLVPTTSLTWIKRQEKIISLMTHHLDAPSLIPNEVWSALRQARSEAIVTRDEILDLTVQSVEVEEI